MGEIEAALVADERRRPNWLPLGRSAAPVVTGLPVSTIHVVTLGIAYTMVGAKAVLDSGMIRQIVGAWVLTLPVTVLVFGGLFLAQALPSFQWPRSAKWTALPLAAQCGASPTSG